MVGQAPGELRNMERHRDRGEARPTAASLNFAAMGPLMQKMPTYTRYTSLAHAVVDERVFRRALGSHLKQCGDRLLSVVEKKAQIMSTDMEQTIDVLVGRIGDIFRRLDREGVVALVGHSAKTIAEIEQIDTRLVLLIEESLALVHNLGTDVPAAAWFKTDATRLARSLIEFNKLTEERNYLLGLGWESEFQPKTRRAS